MTKPTELPQWDESAANLVKPSAELTAGWTFGEEPPSSYFNWWQNNVYKWLAWQESRLTEDVVLGPFAGMGGTPNVAGYVDTSAATHYVGLPLIPGGRLRQLQVAISNAVYTWKLWKVVNGAAAVNLASTITHGAPGAFAYLKLDYMANVGPQVLTVGGAGTVTNSTLTRASGNWTTDGIWPNMSVTMSGFANGGNNVTKKISDVTATVLTFYSDTGLVNEVGSGDEHAVAVCPTDLGDPLTYVWMEISGPNVYDVRYKRDDGSLITV